MVRLIFIFSGFLLNVSSFFPATSAILDDLLSSSSIACANAIVLNHAAAKALAIHSSLLRTALDDTQGELQFFVPLCSNLM